MIAKLFQIVSVAMFLHVFWSSYEYLIYCLQVRILNEDPQYILTLALSGKVVVLDSIFFPNLGLEVL